MKLDWFLCDCNIQRNQTHLLGNLTKPTDTSIYSDTLPGQKYLNKYKFVPQAAHDRDTYTTSNISSQHDQ